MTALVLEKHRSHKRAQAGLSHWIKTQKHWDKILKIKTGLAVFPPPHEVYRIERQGKRYYVVFDDPTM
jgi:hypothetical protein